MGDRGSDMETDARAYRPQRRSRLTSMRTLPLTLLTNHPYNAYPMPAACWHLRGRGGGLHKGWLLNMQYNQCLVPFHVWLLFLIETFGGGGGGGRRILEVALASHTACVK